MRHHVGDITAFIARSLYPYETRAKNGEDFVNHTKVSGVKMDGIGLISADLILWYELINQQLINSLVEPSLIFGLML